MTSLSRPFHALTSQTFGLTSVKGGLVSLACGDGELLLLVRAFCPAQRSSNRRRPYACSTAILDWPANPFPPIRPKVCVVRTISCRAKGVIG